MEERRPQRPPRQRPPQGRPPRQGYADPYYAPPAKKKAPIALIAVSAIAVLFFLLWLFATKGDDALKTRVKELESQNKALESQIAALGAEPAPAPPAASEEKAPEAAPQPDAGKKMYGPGEEWVVDGQWKLVVHSAKATTYRNEYTDADLEKPVAIVVQLVYSYENLGYEGDMQDLYFSPEKAVSGSGDMGEFYSTNGSIYPQATPIGAKCNNVDAEGFAFFDDTNEITVYFEKWDNDGNLQKATFKLPIEK